MLAKAVQEHHPGPVVNGKTLSEHYKGIGNVLKPSPSSVLNSSRQCWPAAKNPLKRSASQIDSREASCNSQRDMGRRPGLINSVHSSQGSRLESLHVNVVFDEDDFDDDNNIDLDEEQMSAATKKQSPPGSAAHPLPPLDSKTDGNPQTPIGSTPLPWSSSPSAHYQIPPPKVPLPAPKPGIPANTAKRRTLPWIDGQKLTQDRDLDMLGPPPPSEGVPARSKKHQEAYTPLPKDKPESPFPWNKSASAVKEEQKKLRQGNKKLIKASEGSTEKASIMKKKRRETMARVFLSDEQKQVLQLVADRQKSVFFTGSAGTGKSVLLREAIKVLRDKYKREPDRVAVTASTGLAACNVGGVTLHSFAGIGLGKENVPELVKKIKRNQKTKQRWMRTKVLIIDEISMVDGDLFDKLEAIARTIRNNGRPFGGIQLVITGDFFQLPPVPDYGKVAKFAFDGATWTTSIEHTIGLTQVFRQKDPGTLNITFQEDLD